MAASPDPSRDLKMMVNSPFCPSVSKLALNASAVSVIMYFFHVHGTKDVLPQTFQVTSGLAMSCNGFNINGNR
jgi:hypothetical protein